MPSTALFEAAAKAWDGAASGPGAPPDAPAAPAAAAAPAALAAPAAEAKSWGIGSGGAPARYLGPDMVHRGEGFAGAPRTPAQVNYAAKVGPVWQNNSVFTAINWIRRNFPDARPAVEDVRTEERDLAHPMAQLLLRPNPYYSYSTLAAGLVFSYVAEGDAYALKQRDGYGRVKHLYWRPHWMLRPFRLPGSDNFIDGYRYKPDARTPVRILPPSEVVHLRNGIDPEDEMRGMSDLKRLLLTVYTEQEAQRFLAAILGKLGLPGAIIRHKPVKVSADGSGELEYQALDPKAAELLKARYEQNFSGENVGSAMVLDGDFEVDFPSISIDAAFIEKAKDLSQADIAAAIGVPAVVVGWHVGMKNASAKASHEDARKQAYRECIMPMHRSMGEDLDVQLLPDFGPEGYNLLHRTVWDYRGVATLAEDANAVADRWTKLYTGGVAMRSEARKGAGMPAREGGIDDVFHQTPSAGDGGSGEGTPKNTKRPGSKPAQQKEEEEEDE